MTVRLIRRQSEEAKSSREPARRAHRPATDVLPAYLQSTRDHSEQKPLRVQRDDKGGPSLLDEKLELDPELQQWAARMRIRRLLDSNVLAEVLENSDFMSGSADVLQLPKLPESKPLVPRGAGPKTARAAKPGDLLGGIMKIPSVERALDRLGDQAADRAARDWGSLSLGGKSAVVSTGVLLGGGLLTGVMSDPDARGFVLGQLDGKVLPVPYTEGTLGLELNTKGDNVMLGVHLDVGRFLPKSLGFGKGKPTAIGGPPKKVGRAVADASNDIIARKAGCSCGGSCASCGGVQLSRPADPDEVEADHIAERITSNEPSSAPLVSRSAQNDELRRTPTTSAPSNTNDLAGRIRRLEQSPGAPLPPYVQTMFEQRLGADLSAVRVHTGAESAQLANSTNARAFTVGRTIAFAGGEYSPDTTRGQRLLAHELVHVVQNGGG